MSSGERVAFRTEEADPELERRSRLRLWQLLAIVPPGSSASGWVEKDGTLQVANFEIHAPSRVFSAKSVGRTPGSAAERALLKLEEQIYRWRAPRAGSGMFASSTGLEAPER